MQPDGTSVSANLKNKTKGSVGHATVRLRWVIQNVRQDKNHSPFKGIVE